MGGFLEVSNPLVTEGFFGVLGGGGGGTVVFSLPTVTFGSTGPSFNGPGQSYFGGASSGVLGTPSGFTGGSISPDPTLVNGVGIVAFGNMSTSPAVIPPNGNAFVMILNQAGLPQNFFTSLDFVLGDSSVWHLTTAGAQFNNPWDDTATTTGYTTWVWPNTLPFFPPPSWPNPITLTL